MTIKEVAGRTILYFYQLQRAAPASMQHRQLGFIDKADGKVSLTSDKKWFSKDLLDIGSNSSDVFNAFRFLLDKDLIRARERAKAGARIYVDIHLTANGIDIVEGVESGQEGKRLFSSTFNMNGDSPDVNGLIREHLEGFLK